MSDAAACARSPRALWAACAGLGVAAALLWGGSVAVWYIVEPPDRSPVELTGAQVSTAAGGTALLALAGVAALVATAGPVRRAVGLLLAAAGIAVGGIAVRALLNNPFTADAPASTLPQPPAGVAVDALRDQPVEITLAPLLAVAGALALAVVGVVVLLGEPRLPRFGARYSTGAARRAELDPDRAAWQDLDAGRDPTTDPDSTLDPSLDPTPDRPQPPKPIEEGPGGTA